MTVFVPPEIPPDPNVAAPAPDGAVSPDDDSRMRERTLHRQWTIFGAVLVVQLGVLVVMSTYLFHRFDLTDDFATYNQAFSLIGHGHLNPVDTIHAPSFPFWQNHFELAMWPLAVFSPIWPHSLWLLWLQDVAIVAAQAIAMLWITRYLVPLGARRGTAFGALALVLLATNAWWYETASFDVHFEVFGIPFVVLAAYWLWSGSPRWAFVAAAVALLFGDVVATYVILVGLAGMASSRVRREGRLAAAGGLALLGTAWFLLALLLHANQGSGIVTNYGYLVSAGPHASSWSVLGHVAVHPGRVTREVFGQWRNIGHLLASSGILGVLSPWGFFMFVGVAVPSALNVNKAFITPEIAFQTVVVVPFMVVGTVAVLLAVAGEGSSVDSWRGRRARRSAHRARPVAAVVLAAVVLAVGLVQSIPLLSQLRSQWWRVDSPAAATLRRALPAIPPDAQVIASQGVIGRFAGRTYVYPLLASSQLFPVAAGRPVVFVIVPATGLETFPAAAGVQIERSLSGRRDMRVLVDSSGVMVVLWHPPPGTTHVALPDAAPG